MNLEVTLPPNASMIAPLFITAPCNHSGGAMLQRLICTHENGICFGDNLFDEVLSLIDWSVALIDRHQNTREPEAHVLAQAIAGKPARWMPELAPPFDLYTSSLFSVVYNLPYTTQEFARENGRDVWGMARAGVAASRIGDLLSVFPQSKAIFIYRNPMDVVRDRKRDMPQSVITEVCAEWNLSMRDYLAAPTDRLTKIRYEDTQSDSAKTQELLETITGLNGLSLDVLSEGNEAELESNLELTEQEVAQIQLQCADMLAVYYPEMIS